MQKQHLIVLTNTTMKKVSKKKNHEDIFASDGKYILGITNVSYSVTKSSNRSAVSFNLHYKIKSKSI